MICTYDTLGVADVNVVSYIWCEIKRFFLESVQPGDNLWDNPCNLLEQPDFRDVKLYTQGDYMFCDLLKGLENHFFFELIILTMKQYWY